MVLAQELPDVLDGVQLGRIGRQLEQTDIAWDPQLFARLVPSGSIEEQDGRTAAALCPDAGQCALLTNPGFVLPPKFDRFFARMLGDDGFDQIGEVFLCVSCAAGSCCGWGGRPDKRRNPSRRSIAPTLRSAKVTLNFVLITRAR